MSGPDRGRLCVFPFIFKGTTYISCTEWEKKGKNKGKKWCSTKVDSDGIHISGGGNHGFCGSPCDKDSYKPPSSPCTTVSGPDTGRQCVFPFIFKGITYVSCTDILESPGREWCSTKVDSDGNHINGQGYYGYCGSDCGINNNIHFTRGTSPLHLSLGTKGMNTKNACSVVLVAGYALDDLQSVKATVKSLTHQMMRMPYLMVLLVDNQNIKLDTSSHPMDPAMVSCRLHTPYHTIPYYSY